MLTDAHITRPTEMRTTRLMDGHHFENHLVLTVSYNPGFKSIGVFELESGKHNMDGCMHAQIVQMDGHQFQKQPRSGGVLLSFKFQIDLSFKSIERSVFKLESGTKIFWMSTHPKQANGQTPISKAT